MLMSLLELSVLFEDVLVRSTLGRHIRVVLSAQDVWGALERVMADSPASLGVAIDLPDARIDPDAHRGNECSLTEVGTKARPEVVILVRPSMKSTRVKREPVPYRIEEHQEKRKSDDAKHEK